MAEQTLAPAPARQPGRGWPSIFKQADLLFGLRSLARQEQFSYHPHITLAQDLLPEQVQQVYRPACRRWARCNGSRRFALETITLVQNTADDKWIDLAEQTLAPAPAR